MNKTFMRLISVFAGIIVCVISAQAQITTSALNGKITDNSGSSIIGAVIVAVHQPTGSQYHAVTNNEGRYFINGMRAGGPYIVTVSCLGYQNIEFNNVTLQLAENTTIDSQMNDDTQVLDEAIVISDATSKFSAEKTGAATNINNKDIMNIPSVSRSITDVARMSPYGGNGMNFSGTSGRSANFTVDGANFNNNFGLSTALPGGGTPISIDAIEEMQVVISPFDVRQTNFIGGGINAITKSGTNTFKGSAYVYHRNENMHGNRIDGTELSAREKDMNTTYGFTLGGPIIKNKLFFFANFEQSIIPTSVNRWRTSTDGVGDTDQNITRVTSAEAEKMRNFLIDKYGYDPGSYSSYPADEQNIKVLARIDWNINQDHKLALRYNYTNNTAWKMPSTSRDITTFTESAQSKYGLIYSNSMYGVNNKISTISADLNSRFGNNVSNQLLITYSDVDDVRSTKSDPFPFVEVAAGDLGEPDYPYIDFGYELFSWGNRVQTKVLTVKDDVTYYLGSHKIMAGASFERQKAINIYMRNGTGMFRYDSLSEFYAGAAPSQMAFDWGYNGETYPSATVRFYQVGLYAQDEWAASDKFKLTYGLRFDTILFNNEDIMTNNAILALDYGGRNVDTGKWPTAKLQVSPRIGFNWDTFGNKSLIVRGGTGLFAGRLPLVFFTNMPTNSGMIKGRATKINRDKDAELLKLFANGAGLTKDPSTILNILNNYDPERFPKTFTPEQGTVTGEFCGVDKNFKMPQVWKSNIALEYNIPVSFPFSIGGEFIYNKTINGVMLDNYNIKDNSGWSTFNGADKRHIYPESYKYYDKYDAYVLTNTNQGYGWTASAELKIQPIKNLRITAAYTHTVAKEVTGMPGSNAAAAWQYIPSIDGPNFNTLHNSSYNNPDRIMASLTYTDKGDNTFSLFYEATRYGGYSYMYANDLNNDGYSYDLMYIPRDESEICFVSADDAKRYWDFANQDEYLSTHKGQYAEAYDVTAPFVHTIDFHYAHDFKFKIGKSINAIQINCDIMNLTNLFNSSWGVAKTLSDECNKGRLLKYEYTNTDGMPVYSTKIESGAKTWNYSHTYGNCWYMQIGLRYIFN